MAKMIKCPTCGTQIEVPPQAAGQIVKCPGCGKGLKLVAKPKPGGGGPGGAGMGGTHAGAGLGGHPGGSISGSSVSAMTFVGEPPPMDRPGPAIDDLPSLDSNCAVCGRPTDPEDLIEDNGRLVCGDCIKGARSGIARAEGGAELIEFKAAAGPVRRGKLINFTPSFFIGLLAALVLIGTQIYLTLFEKPVGTRTAMAHTLAGSHGSAGGAGAGVAGAPAPQATDPDTGLPMTGATDTSSGGATSAPASPTDTTAGGAGAGTPAAPGDTTAQGTPPATPTDSTNPSTTGSPPPSADGASPTSNPTVALAPGDPAQSTIFTDGAAAPGAGGAGGAGAAGGAAQDPGAAVVAPQDMPAPAPAVVSSDPLARGVEQLMAREYAKAITDLDAARLKYVVKKIDRDKPLTPQQQMTLEGLAAAYIGLGRFDAARGQIDTLYAHQVRSRSLTLNLAIYSLNTQRQLPDLLKVAEFVRTQMGQQQNDEYAADIFGTLVNKIANMDRAPKDKVEAWWKFHDNYIDALAARGDVGHPGELKWGIDWLPAAEVQGYRQARGIASTGGNVQAAAKEVELAMQRKNSAERALKLATGARANGDPADVQGAQSQLNAADAALEKAKKALNDVTAAVNVKNARWLSKFPPVIPQQAVAP